MIECLSKINKPVIGMAEVSPLPGSYLYNGESYLSMRDALLQEVEPYALCGFDGVIIQNMGDTPIRQNSSPEAIAYMTMLSNEVKKTFPKLVLGILMCWDGCASLAVAAASNADFIRVEHCYVGAEVTTAGIIDAQCVDILRQKKLMMSNMPITVDIYEPHAQAICPRNIAGQVYSTITQGHADALFLCGNSSEETKKMLIEARPSALKNGNVPLYVGGNTNDQNVYDLLKVGDGVCIGHWIKDGNLRNPINKNKLDSYFHEVERARTSNE